jgi:hypothetical protein
MLAPALRVTGDEDPVLSAFLRCRADGAVSPRVHRTRAGMRWIALFA